MGWLQQFLRLRINGPLDIAVLGLMNRSKQIEIAFPMFLFSEHRIKCKFMRPCYRQRFIENYKYSLSRFGAQIGCPTDVVRTQNEFVPAVDSLALILSRFESGRFKSRVCIKFSPGAQCHKASEKDGVCTLSYSADNMTLADSAYSRAFQI